MIMKGRVMSTNKNMIVKYGLVLCGAFLYSISISLVLSPNNLAPGGVTGISIIINYVTGFPIGIMTFIMNIPLLIISLFKFGKIFFVSTIFTIAAGTVFTDILSFFPPITEECILAALLGSAINGIGLGLIFKNGTTSGGTDILVRLLKLKYPHISTGGLFIILDMIVVTISGIVFKNTEAALYAAVCVILSGMIMDKVIYGTDEAKLVYIISDKKDDITRGLLDKIDIGVTFIDGKGAYSNERKDIIMCAMKKQKLPLVKDLVKNIDDRAFVIITSATQIVGEGFKSPKDANI